MGRLVMKFGGTSVANLERIRNVARHVKREVDAGHDVAVVVSAMAGKTNELVEWCREASPMHDAREYDAVVASGEQVTAGLLAIALQAIGIQARSWQGWQIPIRTSDAHASARILEIDGSELITRFKERKEVAVVAGFQGINPQTGRITTLGRGGSDTSAVAIAAAIHADRCDIYTDVDGVYTTDPRVVPKARRLDRIAFEDMLELASQGAKVLQVRSVELGMVHNMPIFVRSSFDKPEDIDPHGTPPGTLICSEEEIMENHVVTGIAFSKDEAQISVRQIQDKPGVAASIFGPLADANINVDMIVQNVSEDGATTDLTFTVPASDYARAREIQRKYLPLMEVNFVESNPIPVKAAMAASPSMSSTKVKGKQMTVVSFTVKTASFQYVAVFPYQALSAKTREEYQKQSVQHLAQLRRHGLRNRQEFEHLRQNDQQSSGENRAIQVTRAADNDQRDDEDRLIQRERNRIDGRQ